MRWKTFYIQHKKLLCQHSFFPLNQPFNDWLNKKIIQRKKSKSNVFEFRLICCGYRWISIFKLKPVFNALIAFMEYTFYCYQLPNLFGCFVVNENKFPLSQIKLFTFFTATLLFLYNKNLEHISKHTKKHSFIFRWEYEWGHWT